MSALTRDGRSWTPGFLLAIDAGKCIGCGRCFKVCGRGVLVLRGVDEEGTLVDLEGDDEVERKVMALADAGACIGCGACGKVCTKACQTYGST